MGATKNKFIKLIEGKGWKVKFVNWEAVSYNGRDGREGGWHIELDIEDEYIDCFDNDLPILGYNRTEVLEKINQLPIKPITMNTDSIQGNKIIAHFMGATYMQHTNEMGFIHCEDGKYHDGTNCRKVRDLKYHSSWDWLMPVVQKIQSMGYSFDYEGFNKCSFVNFRDKNEDHDLISRVAGNDMMRAIYKGVIEFIKWYNSKQVKQ